MGKQGTITSFFRPDTATSTNKNKSTAKPSRTSSESKKRPRPRLATPQQISNNEGSSKRLKKLSEIQDPDLEAEHPEGKDEVIEVLENAQPGNISEGKRTTSKSLSDDTQPSKASSSKITSLVQDRTSSSVDNKLTPEKTKEKVAESEGLREKSAASRKSDEKLAVSEKPGEKGSSDIEQAGVNGQVVDSESDDGSESENSDTEFVSSSPNRPKKTVTLDVSRLVTKQTWKNGAPVPYKFVADAFAKVEEISGRLEIQAILTQLFRDIISSTPEDLVPTIYLCINKLAPAHLGIELGIGESILLKAMSQVTGRSVPTLKATYKTVGDLGDVASTARTNQKTMFPPPPLTVRKVFAEFKAIAQISGKSTQDAKRAKIVKMMVAASRVETKYIARALLGKLRIHLADKTVIAALASAVTLERMSAATDILLTVDGKKKSKMSSTEEAIETSLKEATVTLNAVYSQLPVWDVIVPKLLELGVVDKQLVETCKLMPGVPVSPMLAKPTKAIAEVLDRFEESTFTCEFKYDGERAQVHKLSNGSMKIYSRNAEDLTPKYPDLVRDLPNALHEKFKKASFIIDAEAVAFDLEKRMILPFQELQGRKRKDVSAEDVKVKVCIFAFDLLFFNNESLISETFSERRKRLCTSFVECEGQFMFAKGHDSRDPEQIMGLLNDSVKAGCEGLMVKALEGPNSTYEPANRSQNWLKVKKDYLDGCGDSLDLIPIGGYLGRGKRVGTYGAFLLACYDPDAEEYQSICKIGTGFSEADLEEFAKLFKIGDDEHVSRTVKSYYRTPAGDKLRPDVWFEPVQVWEVKCADLSVSPQHTAAIGHIEEDKGIALRFPRFIRVREDKKPEEATTAEQVAEFYLRQSSIANKG